MVCYCARMRYRHELDRFKNACFAGNVIKMNNTIHKIPTKDWIYAFYKACEGGHMNAVKTMFDHCSKVKDFKFEWDSLLNSACKGGVVSIVNLIIQREKKDNEEKEGKEDCRKYNHRFSWNYALHGACEGGHLNIVKLMIKKGRRNFDWNWALED